MSRSARQQTWKTDTSAPGKVWRDRVDYPSLKAKVQELALRAAAYSVLVEEAGTSLGLIDELQ